MMGKRGTDWIRLAFLAFCAAATLAFGLLFNHVPARSAAQADQRVVIFRQGLAGYTGCSDTRISEENPNTNFGNQDLILGMRGRISTLIRFDVSAIPSNAVIQGAALSIYVANYGQRGSEASINAAYVVSRTWEEMQATWYKATNLDYWGLPGCNSTSNDRSSVPLSSQPIYNIGWYTWTVTSAVQRWVQDPASNRGVMLRQTNTSVGGEYDIRQSEFPGLEMRPCLIVTYTLSTPTPTPTSTLPGTPTPLPCMGTPETGAVLAVLQQGMGYNGTEDTFLSFDERETSFAGEWYIHVGYKRKDSGLLKFDLSGIPRGSRVICAALSLFAERWSGGPLAVGAYYVKRENSIPAATWTWATSLMPWQMGGCNGPDDRSQMPASVTTVTNIYTRYSWDLTQLVDDWVNGKLSNFGVSLQAMEELDQDTVWFTSSEDVPVANRPILVVLYVPPAGPTFTPTATAMRTATLTATPTRTSTPTRTPSLTSTPGMTIVTFQNGLNGYSGCYDTRISSESSTLNFANSDLKVGARQHLATLISFDLSNIPGNATVISATLSVYSYQREGSGSFGVDIYAVRRPWIEDQATWNTATSSVAWGLPGCNSTFSDRAEMRSDGVSVGATGWYTWSVRDDVQRIVNQPGTNAGWLLRQSTELPGALYMHSSEHTTTSQRPKLSVAYSVP